MDMTTPLIIVVVVFCRWWRLRWTRTVVLEPAPPPDGLQYSRVRQLKSKENIMPKEAHNKAAEHHDIAAKSHRLAADQHGKGERGRA